MIKPEATWNCRAADNYDCDTNMSIQVHTQDLARSTEPHAHDKSLILGAFHSRHTWFADTLFVLYLLAVWHQSIL